MDPSVVDRLHLTSFKSFRQAELPLQDLTLLVGRNGSGKSNALDGLWVLSRLAEGEDIRQALDGGPDGPAVRGGVAGCAPFGETDFTLGCEVRTASERVHVEVTVQVEPAVQVRRERLRVWQDGWHELLTAEDTASPAAGGNFLAEVHDWPPGRHRKVSYRPGRMLTSQVQRIVRPDEMGQRVQRAANQVLAALRNVFVLDPIPHLMRQYVPRRDVGLRRNAENLSAAAARLLANPATGRRLRQALDQLNEQEVVDLGVARSELDDVMLTLVERWGGREHSVPVRLMSDGSLRFLAILVALMQPEPIDEEVPSEEGFGMRTLVIEELEDGLHASQAATLVELIREQVRQRPVRVLATAHSPALLDALSGPEHAGVIVCQRAPDGTSVLQRLTDLPAYLAVVAGGGLGRAAVGDRLRSTDTRQTSASALLDEILRRPPT
jgi:predicted ATPase